MPGGATSHAGFHRVASAALRAALVVFAGGSEAFAEAGPISRVFPAQGAGAPLQWSRECYDADGATLRVFAECSGNCDEPLDLVVARLDEENMPVGAHVRVNERPAYNSTWLGCSPDGRFVVTWQDYATNCYFLRSFDASLTPVSRPFHLAEPDTCRPYVWPDVILYPDASVLAAWSDREADDHDDLYVRRFGSDGTPFGSAVRITSGEPGWSGWGYAAWNEMGTTLVVWSLQNWLDYGHVFARVLDPIGHPLSDPFLVSDPPIRDYIGGAWTQYEGDGVFTVYWQDWDAGGAVGRRVSLDVDSAPPTTTTTLPPPSLDIPRFGEPRLIEHAVSYYEHAMHGEIHDGAGAAWYVRTDEHIFATPDDARRWRDPVSAGGDRYPAFSVATDGNGVWLGLYPHYFFDDEMIGVDAVRSADDGATWGERSLVAAWYGVSNDCDNCEIPRARVASDSSGTAVAVWTFSDWEYGDYEETYSIADSKMLAVRTDDGGLTWSAPQVLSDVAYGYSGFDIATDGEGSWVVMWSDGADYVVRSADGGRTWTEPSLISEGAMKGLELAAGTNGEWLAVFEGTGHGSGDYGYDDDVFAIRSRDGGATWGPPVPVNAYAASDASRDVEPSIATDRNGRWAVAWSSHHPLGGTIGLDADILVSASEDGGATWSSPVAVNPAAETDSKREYRPRIAADERGVWMLTWRSREPGSSYEQPDDLYAALAGDACGDALLDAGEQCDDGNASDGDGCDRNCTSTGCGNSIVTQSEECDDGNLHESDDCLNDCMFARCGDGRVQADVEECDDGNRSNTDDCSNDCAPARCGDGFVQAGVEECDDGNGDDSDECPASCRPAVCGDGYVRAGEEECDDGNPHDDDGCVSDCRSARCGDGFIRFGVELCDPAVSGQQDFCTDECGITDACGDVDGDGLVLASDARKILLVAVGIRRECPLAACDLDASGRVTVTDARLALLRAVGLAGNLKCSAGGYVVFVLPDARKFGALQLEIDYRWAGGFFPGVKDRVHCTTLVRNALVSYNHEPSEQRLSMGFISLAGFAGPRDLARCRYFPGDVATSGVFLIEVQDAAETNLTPIQPYPAITYRFE